MSHNNLKNFVVENCMNETFVSNVNRLQKILFDAENIKKRDNPFAWQEYNDNLTLVLEKYGFMAIGTAVQLDYNRKEKRTLIKEALNKLGAITKNTAIDEILNTMEAMTGKTRRRGTEKSGYIGNKRQRTAAIDVLHGLMHYCATNGFISFVITSNEYKSAEKISKYRKHGFNILVG